MTGHHDLGGFTHEPLHHRDPPHPGHIGVVWGEPGEDRELAGLHQIAGEHHPGVGDRHHLIALGVAPAGRPQMHDPAAEVEIMGAVVDEVRRDQRNVLQLAGHPIAEPPEHLQVARALRGEVVRLRPVGHIRRLPGEYLSPECVLRVKVRRGEIQPAAVGVADGEREHLLRVTGSHSGLHHQDRMGAPDHPDVGHQVHVPVRHHHQVRGDLLFTRDLHHPWLRLTVRRHHTSPSRPGPRRVHTVHHPSACPRLIRCWVTRRHIIDAIRSGR